MTDEEYEDATDEVRYLDSKIAEVRKAMIPLEDGCEDVIEEAQLAGLMAQIEVLQRERDRQWNEIPQDEHDAAFARMLVSKADDGKAEGGTGQVLATAIAGQPTRPRKLQLDLLQNAMHSLAAGMVYFRDMTDAKFAIQHISQAAELLMKERLHRIDPELILENPKKIPGPERSARLANFMK